jgi:ADP-dependent NAD(P)H-hydrate dehydratase
MNMRPVRPAAAAGPAKHPSTTFPGELPRLLPRKPDSHKGDYGRCLVVGGSLGMAGAVSLCGLAVLRSGAGLVRLAVPKSCAATVAGFDPSYMTAPLPEDASGRIAAGAADAIFELAQTATHVAVGPGLGRSAELDSLVVRLYRELPQPAVFDADALNVLAEHPEALKSPGGPRVLTPHPGEYHRLNGGRKFDTRGAYQADVRTLAAEWKAVVVLKGHHTFVTDGGHSYINNTGNPGMATGGSGDVLTGVIAGLMCQGLNAYDAARLGTYVHGHAGDAAAEDLGHLSLIASDLIRYLPASLQYVVKSS